MDNMEQIAGNENKATIIPLERAIVVVPQEEVKEVTAQGAVENKPVERVIAYSIKDPIFGVFEVVKTANAWWMESVKVNNLITAFKQRQMVKSALVYAGITRDQWQYFNKVHPEFSAVKEACEESKILRYVNDLEEMANDKSLSADLRAKLRLEVLKNTHPDYSNKIKVESDQPLAPTTINNVAIIAGANTAKIEALLEKAIAGIELE